VTFECIWTDRFSDVGPFSLAHYPGIVDAIHKASDRFIEEPGRWNSRTTSVRRWTAFVEE
jgi:hypothetical protein